MDYLDYRYLYPPRPELKAPASSISTFEKMGMWAQPKLNGSCALIFMDGKTSILMNRHHEPFARQLITSKDMLEMHRGEGWMVLVGELMNKSQRDESGKVFNATYVIFDILVHHSRYLLGTSFDERQALLDSIYQSENYLKGIKRINDKFFRVENYRSNFVEHWQDFSKIEMHEGLVFKKPDAKLSSGFSEKNNTSWQVKIRKPSKNYSY